MDNIHNNFENTRFFGAGYDEELDKVRLTGQLMRVYNFMRLRKTNGSPWVALHEIAAVTGAPEASASAALRSLRNEHGYIVERKRAESGNGLWLYHLAGKRVTPLKRKMKPVGNADKWGKMMEAIYAYAHNSDLVNEAALYKAGMDWMQDMAHKIYTGEKHG